MPDIFDIRLWLVLPTAALILRLMFWRALFWVKPSVLQLEADEPPEGMKVPNALKQSEGELLELGFLPLGTHVEKVPLRHARTYFDYGHPQEGFFASVTPGKSAPKVTLLAELEDGVIMSTSNYLRPALDWPGSYLSGALEDASPRRLFLAQKRWVGAQRVKIGEMTQKTRLQLAQKWLAGPGKREIRLRHLRGLLWTLASLGMVGHLFFQ